MRYVEPVPTGWLKRWSHEGRTVLCSCTGCPGVAVFVERDSEQELQLGIAPFPLRCESHRDGLPLLTDIFSRVRRGN